MAVMSHRGWWRIATVTVVFALGWAMMWLSTTYHSTDGTWITLYVMGVAACVAWFSNSDSSEVAPKEAWARKRMPPIAVGAATVLAGFVVGFDQFSLTCAALYWLACAGGIALADRSPKRYAAIPFVSAIMAAILVAIWGITERSGSSPGYDHVIDVTLAFAALHIVSGHVLMWRSARREGGRPLLWAAVSAGSAILYFLAAWWRLHGVIETGFPVWGAVAMTLSMMAIEADAAGGGAV